MTLRAAAAPALSILVVAGACDDTIVGTTSPAQIQVGTDRLEFGEATVGSTLTRRLAINNVGEQPLTVTLESDAEGLEFRPGPHYIGGRQDMDLPIQFAPDAARAFVAVLFLSSDAANAGEKRVTLTGTGVDAPRPQRPPEVTIGIEPQSPRTADTLVARAVTSDPDGDVVTVRYRWLRDEVDVGIDIDTIPAAVTSRGQKWSVTATPNDGFRDGAPASTSVVVGNTPPVLDAITIGPDPATAATVLDATPGTTDDEDGDSVVVHLKWTADGTIVSTGTASRLPAGRVRRGQVVRVRATPHDGTDAGAVVVSNAITIANSVPVIQSVAIAPGSGRVGTVFACTPMGWADADGDAEAYDFEWHASGNLAGNGRTLDTSVLSRGDVIRCAATPFDGIDRGGRLESSPVTLGNSPPSIASVTIAPPAPREADTVTVTVSGWVDPDGDSPGYRYAWRVNNVSAGSGPSLDGASFDKGDAIAVLVTPYDGQVTGAAVQSNTVTAANTPPSLSTVTLSPATATTLTDLVVTTSGWTDLDPADHAADRIQWYVAGAALSGATGAVLSSARFSRGDDVRVVVTPHDGEDAGAPVTSRTMTIANSPPGPPTVAIQPAQPDDTSPLQCVVTAASTDPDGDTVTYQLAWTKNGAPTSHTTATIAASDTAVADVWTCTVTPSDGTDTGQVGRASAAVISSAADVWTAMTTNGAPIPRDLHDAVWTSTEMIVYGGRNGVMRTTGGRYDPVLDQWAPVSTTGAPDFHTWGGAGQRLAWAGSEMIAWNGYVNGAPAGAIYHPATNAWRPMSALGQPGARRLHSVVWTGTEMIVWGGCDQTSGTYATGGRYNPLANTWGPTSNIGAPTARCQHAAVWTGNEMVIWGGMYGGGNDTNTGARYDPITDTWSAISSASAPPPNRRSTAVWTGTEMIVFGGSPNGHRGGRYAPSTNTWTLLPTARAPVVDHHATVWTGSVMIVWGGRNVGAGQTTNGGSIYDPGTNQWTPITLNGTPSARYLHTAVWTGSEMIIWGGTSPSLGYLNTGARYRP